MTPKSINIQDFNYPLPQERIAAHPLSQRDACKLLYRRDDGDISEHTFAELPSLIPSDTLLIYNNTRVINARLGFSKLSGARIEIFCLEPHSPADYQENFAATGSCSWLCFVGNSKRWKDGTVSLTLASGTVVEALRMERVGNASIVKFSWDNPSLTFADIIEQGGVIPIPPYLNRESEAADSTDYQTVFSRIKGSVAAPTAGLHFTPELLSRIAARGIERRELTLHVGAGTFQPVKDDDVSRHVMHSEFISVPLSLIEELAVTSRRVYAVGTTSVRTIESLYHIGCMVSQGRWAGELPQWYPYSPSHPCLSVHDSLSALAQYQRRLGTPDFVGATRVIITPGYHYRIVRGMITNFHQPASTLLLLVSAFIGDDWRRCYQYALDHDFRFLSYGDACLFEKNLHIPE